MLLAGQLAILPGQSQAKSKPIRAGTLSAWLASWRLAVESLRLLAAAQSKKGKTGLTTPDSWSLEQKSES
jgi:hypothetical protein